VRDYTAVLALAGGSEDGGARVDAHYMRGVANEKLGDLRAAVADFTEALRLEPTHVKAILARGACHNLASDYEAACGARTPRHLISQQHYDTFGMLTTIAAKHRYGRLTDQAGSHAALRPAHGGSAAPGLLRGL